MMSSYLGEWYENCVQCGNLMFLEEHSSSAAVRTLPSEGKWEALLEDARVASPRRSRSLPRSRRR